MSRRWIVPLSVALFTAFAAAVMARPVAETILYAGPDGQDVIGERCGTPVPTPEEQEAVFQQVKQWLAAHPQKGVGIAAITTIPVAVHVVRSNTGQWDLTDAQINNQISVLNAAYTATNFRFSLASVDRTNNTAWSQHTMGSAEDRPGRESRHHAKPLLVQHRGRAPGLRDLPLVLCRDERHARRGVPLLLLPRRLRRALQPGGHGHPRDRPLPGPLPHVPGRLHRERRLRGRHPGRGEPGLRVPGGPEHVHGHG
jgi:hypothetical protein